MLSQLITSVSKYTISNLKMYVNSIKQSGFSGKKIAVIFTSDRKTLDYLESEGFDLDLYGCKHVDWGVMYEGEKINFLRENVFSDRFYRYWKLLKDGEAPTYSIITDCRDVVFQRDPEKWLEKNLTNSHPEIVVSTENMKYKNELWNSENLQKNYPEFSEVMKNNVIYNAGVIAGYSTALADLTHSIYLTALAGRKQRSPKLTSTDQSAYNLIMQLSTWKTRSLFSDIRGNWAAQLGTIAAYPGEIDESPLIKEDRLVNTSNEEYYIVHQYDRIESINNILKSRFDK